MVYHMTWFVFIRIITIYYEFVFFFTFLEVRYSFAQMCNENATIGKTQVSSTFQPMLTNQQPFIVTQSMCCFDQPIRCMISMMGGEEEKLFILHEFFF